MPKNNGGQFDPKADPPCGKHVKKATIADGVIVTTGRGGRAQLHISDKREKRLRRSSEGEVIMLREQIVTAHDDDAEYALALQIAAMKQHDIPLDIRLECSAQVMDRVWGRPTNKHQISPGAFNPADAINPTSQAELAKLAREAAGSPGPVDRPDHGTADLQAPGDESPPA